ncbi:YhcH/YjgK/YiaL family protein [Fundicoccus culcitae]|uniref:YhcH/YjgK/YiaL family protein n=1 Tax=Fundicoccus culcitae TaxID=2969821 RepID=A0ABY5P7I2_9LACT|nr:YhcH/YjgK/YiaL family protein [Fundicoccus culcitae]UUX34686.1 YhcH/YjgK/YiaL family protein [Fundicoccus culcitae]
MIIDTMDHLKHYPEIFEKIETVLETILKQTDYELGQQFPFEHGFYFFGKDKTLAADLGDYEAHRKYIDIQILLKGNELLYWNPIESLDEVIPYDAEKDIIFYDGSVDNPFSITAGTAYILFPWDAHKAARHIDQASDYEKVVIKLEIV